MEEVFGDGCGLIESEREREMVRESECVIAIAHKCEECTLAGICEAECERFRGGRARMIEAIFPAGQGTARSALNVFTQQRALLRQFIIDSIAALKQRISV